MLIKTSLAQILNTPVNPAEVLGPTRHVVPRAYNPGWYPFWDAHYTDNFYVASGTDDISWGRERHLEVEDPHRSKRRSWIEAIQDHEGFSQHPGRDEVITCGVGGCEWYTLSLPGTTQTNNEDDGIATNKTLFRHNTYWDWLGRTVTNNAAVNTAGADPVFGAANTYRTDHVSTVAIIQYTSHFLTGGATGRDVVRFDYRHANNNTYWRLVLPNNNVALSGGQAIVPAGRFNVSTDVTDIFVLRPSHWFIICRTRMNYHVADYTTMTTINPDVVRDNVDAVPNNY